MNNNGEHPSNDRLSIRAEFVRKSMHLGMIVVPIWYYYAPHPQGLLGLIIATTAAVSLDTLRLRHERVKALFQRLFRPLIRSHEQRHLLGSTHFLIAAVLSALVFAKMIVISALCYPVVGDAAAAIVGKRFGRPRRWGKSLEGSAACFVCCLLIGFLLLDSVGVAVAGAVTATLAEAIPAPVNDNMRVPILSGLVMQIISHTQG